MYEYRDINQEALDLVLAGKLDEAVELLIPTDGKDLATTKVFGFSGWTDQLLNEQQAEVNEARRRAQSAFDMAFAAGEKQIRDEEDARLNSQLGGR